MEEGWDGETRIQAVSHYGEVYCENLDPYDYEMISIFRKKCCLGTTLTEITYSLLIGSVWRNELIIHASYFHILLSCGVRKGILEQEVHVIITSLIHTDCSSEKIEVSLGSASKLSEIPQ